MYNGQSLAAKYSYTDVSEFKVGSKRSSKAKRTNQKIKSLYQPSNTKNRWNTRQDIQQQA